MNGVQQVRELKVQSPKQAIDFMKYMSGVDRSD